MSENRIAAARSALAALGDRLGISSGQPEEDTVGRCEEFDAADGIVYGAHDIPICRNPAADSTGADHGRCNTHAELAALRVRLERLEVEAAARR
ncbi:MAG: hypothetical protein ACRDXE_10535 [Acidimicrobiales bacterium]